MNTVNLLLLQFPDEESLDETIRNVLGDYEMVLVYFRCIMPY